jgi:3-(3-hydroxy-phenyl)propionate hydroxylase
LSKKKAFLAMKRYQVVIAGAGTTGTIAAYALARRGIDVLLVEACPDCPEDLRASTFHPPTLEMLESLDLLDELQPLGLRAPIYQYRNRRSGEVLAFDLTEVGDVLKYPYRLQCEQWKLSRLICARIADHPHADIIYNHRVIHLDQDANGVTVSMEGPHAVEQVRADYLIAADGANSVTRKWLGVSFDGFTYPEKFLTLTTLLPAEAFFENLSYVNYVADAQEWCVLLRVPSLWRILAPAAETDSDDTLRGEAKKNQVFGGLFGEAGVAAQTVHRTVYRVHQRVAQRFRVGRVLLIGDSAHLNNPLGGLGMNCGIHDAMNLVEKLSAILLENADADSLLERYHRQRRAVMNDFVQSQTIRNKQYIEAGAEAQQQAQAQMAATLADPDARRHYLLRQAMYHSLEMERAIL